MKIAVIVGSVRLNSESARIAEVVARQLRSLYSQCELDVLSLREADLPLWNDDSGSDLSQQWPPIAERLRRCDAYVVVTPEWAGMVPPHLKNLFLLCSAGELAHKPAQIISISSGMGGAYPVSELRMSSYKNNLLIWLPDHLVLRNVTSLFVSEPPTALDIELLARLDYSLTMLVATSQALAPVRESVQNLTDYGYGM